LYTQYGWRGLFCALAFAVPDVSLVVHVVSRRAGAVVYNLAHSYVPGVGFAALGCNTPGVPKSLSLRDRPGITFKRR
jgi:hypothetical protein